MEFLVVFFAGLIEKISIFSDDVNALSAQEGTSKIPVTEYESILKIILCNVAGWVVN